MPRAPEVGAGRRAPVPSLALLLALATACATPSREKEEAVYGPTESVLEVVAVLRRHVPDDTYRFPPAVDFSGRNVYRAALLRLESLEQIHENALRAGHLDAVIAFSKGRALERLRAYDLAAQHYRAAAAREGPLREQAERSARFCQSLADAVAVGIDLSDPLSEDERAALPLDPEGVVAELDERVALLTSLLDRVREEELPEHYGFIVREEVERADVARARYFQELRHVLPEGSVRAVAELQRLASRHSPSKNHQQHLLALADLYAEIAQEYVESNPPESLRFDPPRFHELVDSASRLYRIVANQDGTPEKLEAARRFEAFLAFTLRVDSDRFTP